jgi:hypothetical protein
LKTFMTKIREVSNSLTHSLTHGAEPFLRSCQLCSHSRNSQRFMKPKVHYRVHNIPPLIPILSQIDPIHTIPSHPIYLRSILILSTHLRLGLPRGLFHSGIPTNILYEFLFSSIRATCPAPLVFLDLIILIILGEEYKL